MHSRFRTLLLTGAALLGMSAAAQAQTFVNGSPSTIGGVTKFVWNDQNISLTNPLPVAVVSGGGGGGGGSGNAAVTSNGTDGQATSSTNQNNVVYNYVFNGSTWDRLRGTGGAVFALAGQYNSTLPTLASGTSGFLAVDSNGRLIQSPGASVSVSNFPATQAVSGTVAVTQSTSPWVVSNGGTFAVQNTAAVVGGNATAVKTDSSATTQPISAATLPLPAGASTSANQATEITALNSIALGAQTFAEASAQAVAASATFNGTPRDGGTAIPWTRFNAAIQSSQAGTLVLQGSNDNFTTGTNVSTISVTANVVVTAQSPVLFRYYRAFYTNGSTAASITLQTSFTKN